VTCQIQSGTKVGRRFLGTMQKRTELSRIVKNIEMMIRKTNGNSLKRKLNQERVLSCILNQECAGGYEVGFGAQAPPPSKGGANLI